MDEEFEQRRQFVASLDNLAIVIPGGYMKDARPDNQFFPHSLYGTEVRTGESVSYSLDLGIPETLNIRECPPLIRPDQATLEQIARLPLVGETPEQHMARLDKLREGRMLDAFQEVLAALWRE